MIRVMLAAALGLSLVACSGDDDDDEVARDLGEAITLVETLPVVTKVVELSETNDPHDMAGRSEGVVGVAVVYDRRLTCTTTGIECGALIEEWPTAEDARVRSEIVKATQQGMQMLGFEHHFLVGEILLRVVGDLSRRQAAEYEESFAGA